jgi:L-asparaginase II
VPAPGPVPLVGVDRAHLREATHVGHIAVTEASGDLSAGLGNPEHRTYFRSCAKPFQALAGLRTGMVARFGLGPEHLAIMSASHNGEPRHVEVVRDLLARAGVPEDALQCGAHWPLYEPAAAEVRCRMSEPLAVFNNCSGKHAGMLAAARALGAPIDSYLEPDHPVQGGIRAAVEEFTDCPIGDITYGVDGCSAPNPAVPLQAMARSFAALVTATQGDAVAIVEAMTTHPFLVGGTDRLDTRLMEVTSGRLLAKGGAAGAHCTADRRSGRGLAIKLESGDGTWMATAVVAALDQLGWLTARELSELTRFAHPVLRNHRRVEVGTVGPLFELSPVTAV